MGGAAILLFLLFLAGEDEPTIDGEVVPPGPDDDDFVLSGLRIPKEGEPMIPPGPVDRPDDGMTDSEWLAAVDGLVSDMPKQGTFYAVRQGVTASELAGMLLSGAKNTNANRLRLIKCITRVPWNREHYASTGGRDTWGNLYDIEDGTNLSSAWMPRHPSALQALANRHNPVRGIDEGGRQVGSGGYYGLLWIPSFAATKDTLACSGQTQRPPSWLMSRLQG